MSKSIDNRRSHCSVCGKRLSVMTDAGEIAWQPSKVDDKGIYCHDCYPAGGIKKAKKKAVKKKVVQKNAKKKTAAKVRRTPGMQ